MLVLGRFKGERIEIDGHALIRVAKIEEDRVRLDVVAPCSRTTRAEHVGNEPCDRTAIVTVLGIRRRAGSSVLRASIGIRVPVGSTVHRSEVACQILPAEKRFPWHRYRPTSRCWRSISEEIHIRLP